MHKLITLVDCITANMHNYIMLHCTCIVLYCYSALHIIEYYYCTTANNF